MAKGIFMAMDAKQNNVKALEANNLDQLREKLEQACALVETRAELASELLNERTTFFYFSILKEILLDAKKYADKL
jgi:hypothetical protein